MSDARTTAFSPAVEATRMPPVAASAVPSIQPACWARTVSMPFSRPSDRSSTTARMATPVRVPRSSTRNASATATATTTVTIWW